MHHPVPAQPETAETQSLCHSIVPDVNPVWVNCSPQPYAEEKDCFINVQQVIASNGGKAVFGWAIWLVPGVYIEAEFHCIWEDDAGNMRDVTPYPYRFEKILFLPDPKRLYSGRQIDSVRKPLVDDPDVIRWLYLARRQFEIVNTGDLAEQYGRIELPAKLAKEYARNAEETQKLTRRLDRRYP